MPIYGDFGKNHEKQKIPEIRKKFYPKRTEKGEPNYPQRSWKVSRIIGALKINNGVL